MYAVAASAAGVGVLALAQPSEAKIVYTPTHHVIGKKGHYQVDFNNDKLGDFSLVNRRGCNKDFCVDVLSAIPSPGNGIEGAKGFLSIPYASALPRGARIGPTAPFFGRLMASSESSQGTIGKWLNVTNRYLGVRFAIKGKVHFGWARLTVQVLHGAFVKATLTGYAYETIPNKPIVAGKTKSDADERGLVGQSDNADLMLPLTSQLLWVCWRKDRGHSPSGESLADQREREDKITRHHLDVKGRWCVEKLNSTSTANPLILSPMPHIDKHRLDLSAGSSCPRPIRMPRRLSTDRSFWLGPSTRQSHGSERFLFHIQAAGPGRRCRVLDDDEQRAHGVPPPALMILHHRGERGCYRCPGRATWRESSGARV
jgi:hypothetical protein